MTRHYTILGPPVTKKTGQQLVTTGKRPRILPSAAYRQARRHVLPQLRAQHRGEAIRRFCAVTADFYLAKRQRPDTPNLQNALADYLQEAGVVTNDYFLKRWKADWHRDWANPRTEVVIEELERVG